MEIEKLAQKIDGRIVLPTDTEYDTLRSIYNAMVDKRPKLFVKCKNKYDVVQAIHFAKNNSLEIAIKGGGHNGAGLALVENGLVIDLNEMKSIQVNVDSLRAVIEPGNTLADVDKATHEHGLALPIGVNGYTGISGLTLGGGLGFLTRKAGLTIDHLIEAEVVLASGEIVTANKNTNPDLFWALRGGGGNFGVVVSFTFNLIAIKNVFAGPMLWPLESADEVMNFYDHFTKNASQDLYGFFAFLTVPDAEAFPESLRNQKVCGVVWCYTGSMDEVEKVFKPIREFGPPILDAVTEMPLPALNSLFDWAYPPGLQWYWKGHYMNELTDESIKEHLKFANAMPTAKSTMHLYPVDGKAHEVALEDTAWAHRDVRWVQVIIGVSEDPKDKKVIRDWSRKYYDAMIPYSSGGGYVNFMMHEGQNRVKQSYKGNYERLRIIKKKYDPENFFHMNQNIVPSA
ncbi:FAD-binding oxidoreductase [Allomuricauda sp. SCSIO 65647]|uniref:FAD-binding oxidoreductase n=1 Tax=Allomuricauda sp. SCSIO 65647 TaxID=2908843 RepID=UPI001F492296|nr:FAD-binding oxidoreductase [Muricauda sp. SCSIO 65647]UJH68358.1 FAD-binding oxidoreductase [Muricauda sp. SCSIO 65647]